MIYKIDNKIKTLTYHEQSNGVKSLYLQLGLYAIALDFGMVLALDEFDIDLHPDLIPMLVELFEDDINALQNFISNNAINNFNLNVAKKNIVLIKEEWQAPYLVGDIKPMWAGKKFRYKVL